MTTRRKAGCIYWEPTTSGILPGNWSKEEYDVLNAGYKLAKEDFEAGLDFIDAYSDKEHLLPVLNFLMVRISPLDPNNKKGNK